jgi:hypothetical protein
MPSQVFAEFKNIIPTLSLGTQERTFFDINRKNHNNHFLVHSSDP